MSIRNMFFALPYRLGATRCCLSHIMIHIALARNCTCASVTGACVFDNIVFPIVFARNDDMYHAIHHSTSFSLFVFDSSGCRCDTGRGR